MTTTNATNATNTRIEALNFAQFVPAKELRGAFNATAQHNVLQGRVCPKCAEFLGAALGIELPTKTADFIKTVNMALAQQGPKLEPQKKLCEALRFAHEWATLLRECSKAKTLPTIVASPEWVSEAAVSSRAEAKAAKAAATKAAKAEAVTASAVAEALASEAAEAAEESKQDSKLAAAVALVISRAAELSEEQRAMLAAAIATSEDAPV